MKPMLALGISAGWARLVAVFVADVGLLWLGGAVAGRSGWWVAAVLAAALSAVALLTWRRAPVLDLLLRTRQVRPTLAAVTAGALADHDRTYGTGPVGIRGAGPYVVAVVAVDGQAHSPSALDHHRVASLAKLPLAAVAQGLRQFDVALESIDIVSVGIRRAPERHHRYATIYSGLIGDHPAVGQRRTWLVLRFDVRRSARAVLCRESVAATVAAAAQWLAQDLTARRSPARVLTAEQILAADTQVLAGVNPAQCQPHWGRIRHPAGYVQTYWMSPREITSDTVDRLWVPDTDATAVTVQLRPSAEGATRVGVVVRYHTGSPLTEPPLTGLNPLTGRQDLGLAAGSLCAKAPLTVPSCPLSSLRRPLSVAIGASGVIVGTNATGHPLLVDLSSPTQTSTMTLAGELALTVQVALRAAATGYHVVVHTDRPQRWQPVRGAGLQLVGPAGLHDGLPPNSSRWMVVYDQVPGTPPDGAAVVVRTVPAGTASGADIHIEQESPRTAAIRTWAFQYRLRIDLDYERQRVQDPPRRAETSADIPQGSNC